MIVNVMICVRVRDTERLKETREKHVQPRKKEGLCNVAKQLQILLNSYICINREYKT